MSPDNAIQLSPVRPEAMSMTLKEVTDRVNMIHAVLKKVMKEGTHYGTVPGCGNRKVLFKPGADVLAMTFRLVAGFEVKTTDLPNGHREFHVTCTMTAPDGTVLGQGVGSASTMEKKYRYRKDEFSGRIENEDIADTYNTVLKMAKKRAHIDATLTVTGAADIFTQDIIDGGDETSAGESPVAEPKARAATGSDGESVVTGVLEAVSEKSGQGRKGPWTKFGLKVGGEFYGTFDEKMGAAAKSMKGKSVTIHWVQEGDYKTAKAITAAADVPSGKPSDSQDLINRLMPYADGFPKLFAKACVSIGVGAGDWQSAPAEALKRLLDKCDELSAQA